MGVVVVVVGCVAVDAVAVEEGVLLLATKEKGTHSVQKGGPMRKKEMRKTKMERKRKRKKRKRKKRKKRRRRGGKEMETEVEMTKESQKEKGALAFSPLEFHLFLFWFHPVVFPCFAKKREERGKEKKKETVCFEKSHENPWEWPRSP